MKGGGIIDLIQSDRSHDGVFYSLFLSVKFVGHSTLDANYLIDSPLLQYRLKSIYADEIVVYMHSSGCCSN